MKVYTKKIVIVGNSSVGKTCISQRAKYNNFINYSEPTIGAAFTTISIEANNNLLNLQIWDTAGQERFRSIAPMYYRGASAAIIVFDITSSKSFQDAKEWYNEIKKRMNSGLPLVILVGNKCDLAVSRQVEYNDANKYSQDNNIIYLETSAKSGYNIQTLFYKIAHNIPILNENNENILSGIVENMVNNDNKKKRYFCSNIYDCIII